ncbi:ABC-type amino acid transport substrate-binding protein [Enteractinococcus coprophilus]|uniref:ABC-type amino acid transport substrate-binding protein n=2 Tax=Micrococcales TaxID=85006 RepID=A0A543A0F7_9MICC|nr:ABC-type amino acid transport substrate-binding protein [Enteractinococcus coprophilus]
MAAVTFAVVLSGCGTTEDPVTDDGADTEEVVNIGVVLSSPGLASGSDPVETSGAEIALGRAVAAELDTIEPEAQVRWVPISAANDTIAAIQNGELEFMLGQLSESQLTDQLGWVGPYATAKSALLIRQAADETENAITTIEPLESITSAAELVEAPVCVVANSAAASVELPIENVTVQQTVSECEVGMRSGRFDAIAADDMQLAGVMLDPNLAATYELLSWSDIAAEEDLEVADELLEAHQYWIGTDPAHCDALTEALRTVVTQGALVEAFAEWEEATGFNPDIATASQITTKHCPS